MLTKSDKQWIAEEITNQLRAFFEFEVTVEKGPRKQGDPEKVIEKETVNGLAFMLQYMPLIEAALRGVQGDVDRTVNSVDRQRSSVDAIANILLGLESSAKNIAYLSDRIRDAEQVRLVDAGRSQG